MHFFVFKFGCFSGMLRTLALGIFSFIWSSHASCLHNGDRTSFFFLISSCVCSNVEACARLLFSKSDAFL